MKKALIWGLTFAVVFMTTVVGISAPASATGGGPKVCTEQVVDQPAYDEVVVDAEAYDETIPGEPGQWWNFSPNKDQGPFDGPPAFPEDARGTWQGPHTKGGPGKNKEGTFQQGGGHGSWFHRSQGTPDTVVHHDEVTHVEHHDATYKTVVVDCPPKPPKPFKAYEVTVCWQMESSDGIEGTYEFPQNRVSKQDCGSVPECEQIAEYQIDTYWIRDKDDKQYLKNLTVLNSPADDAQLEPHDYYSVVVHGAPCAAEVPTPVINQPTCEKPDVSVTWVSSGEHWTGEVFLPPYSSAPNKVEVMAFADDGYTFKGQSYWEFTINPVDEAACNPVVATPPAATPVAEETALLPNTGASDNLTALGIIALGLLVLGGGVLVASRAKK